MLPIVDVFLSLFLVVGGKSFDVSDVSSSICGEGDVGFNESFGVRALPRSVTKLR